MQGFSDSLDPPIPKINYEVWAAERCSPILGEREVPFDTFLKALIEYCHQGPFILQIMATNEWEGYAPSHLQFIQSYIYGAKRIEQEIC